MKRNLVIAFAMIAALSIQSVSLTASAGTGPDKEVAALMKKDAADLAQMLKKMSPEKRSSILMSYDNYLGSLNSALAKAENFDGQIFLEVGTSGVGLVLGGLVLSIPAAITAEQSSSLLIKKIAGLALRGTVGTAITGAVLFGGSVVGASGKFLMTRVQAHRLRGQVERIQAQVDVIQSLVDADQYAY